MDHTAENYDPEAEANDGSCIDSRLKLVGNYRYTKRWTDVITEVDGISFGTIQITEAGTASNDFYMNLDGQLFIRGAVRAFDLVMYQYSQTETYQGFDFTRTYTGAGEWLVSDTVDIALTLSTKVPKVEGNPPALITVPQDYNYYITKVK
jgi:hypothetical protein